MSIDWSEVVPDLARRKAILVIGSGVSRHSRNHEGKQPPIWKEFLEQAVSDCPDKNNINVISKAIEDGDYLHACEWLKRRYDSRWIGYLRKTFSAPGFEPAAIHQKILDLDCRIVFSMNFDDIYERHSDSVHRGSHIVKHYHDSDVEEFLRGSERYIVKVHGSLKTPTKLIFTQKEYSQARILNSSFYQAFDATLLTHTAVFLGCGLSDPDISLLLENQNFRYQSQAPHFFVTPQGLSEERKISLRENRNLKILEYDPEDDQHSGLLKELDQLNASVEAERFELTKSLNW